MKTISVCMPTTTFPRWADDGEGSFVWGLARQLVRDGVAVRVVALHAPGTASYEEREGVKIWRPRYWWPESREMLRREQGGLPITLKKYPLARIQLLPFLLRHGAQIGKIARDCSLVHAQWSLSAGAALLTGQHLQRPLVTTVQGSDIFRVGQMRFGASLTRTVLNRSHRITALTPALADAAEAMGVERRRIRVIPNGVDTDFFQPPGDKREKLILFVGSYIERKGVSVLLQALPDVFKALPDHRAVLLGNGSLQAQLEEEAQKLGLSEQVRFLDFQPQSEIRRWMQRARVLVLPSLEEGQGVVLLEALSCGTPLVASHVGGIPEVVVPDVGTLVPPGQPAPLTDAIVQTLTDDERWAQLSRMARRRAVEVYDWRVISRKFIRLYEDLIAQNGVVR